MRLIAIVVGLVLTLVAGLLMLTSATGLLLVGFDDTIDTGRVRLDTPTAAIASKAVDLGQDDLDGRVWGDDETAELKVKATSDDGKDVFVGVGPTDEVRAYLDRAAWDEIQALSSGRFSTSASSVDYERKGKSGDPSELASPSDQSFWATSRSGKDVDLDWEFKSGDHTVVLMNADGSPHVATKGSLELKIPRLSVGLIVVGAIGLVLLLVGFLFLFKVGRRRAAST